MTAVQNLQGIRDVNHSNERAVDIFPDPNSPRQSMRCMALYKCFRSGQTNSRFNNLQDENEYSNGTKRWTGWVNREERRWTKISS